LPVPTLLPTSRIEVMRSRSNDSGWNPDG
jgi:hypothetical protein